MWITALFGMATKYAEAILAVKYRVSNENGEYSGGPMYYLERGLGKKWLAILFAIFGTTAFGIGNMVQSNSVAEAMRINFSSSCFNWYSNVILIAIVILGGVKIGKVTDMSFLLKLLYNCWSYNYFLSLRPNSRSIFTYFSGAFNGQQLLVVLLGQQLHQLSKSEWRVVYLRTKLV